MPSYIIDPAFWLADARVSTLSLEAQAICWRLMCMATIKRRPWRIPKARNVVASMLPSRKINELSEKVSDELLTSGLWSEDASGSWSSDFLDEFFSKEKASQNESAASTKPRKKRVPYRPSDSSPTEHESDGFNLALLSSEREDLLFKPIAPTTSTVGVPPTPSIWEMGTQLLCRDGSAPSTARAFLGKLIHEHGEAKVAESLASMSLKAIQPAEAKSYLLGILRKTSQIQNNRGRVSL